MKFKEFIIEFKNEAQNLIAHFEDFKSLSGKEKKTLLDKNMTAASIRLLARLKINPIAKIVITKGLEAYLPVITQAIFDLIQSRIAGITEEKTA